MKFHMSAAELLCKICNKRRPRRYCPGVFGDICAICCGTEREQSVSCPFECPFLQEARLRDPEPDIDPRQFPHAEIKITDDFLRKNEELLVRSAALLCRAALETEGAVDNDVKEALDSLIRTHKTAQSGLIYEFRPANIIAVRLVSIVQENVEELRRNLSSVRDADLLGVFVFLQRLEIQRNNGRRKGRAYIDFLRQYFPPEQEEKTTSLILS